MPPQKTYIKIIKNSVMPLKNYRWLKYQKSRENDFILATMQFSGTHWLRFMIAKALVAYYHLPYAFKNVDPQEIVPIFRDPRQRFVYNDRLDVPRVQQGHLPYRFPYNLFFKNKKVIFLTRDLKDALVSQYDRGNKKIPFSEFLHDQKGKLNKATYGTLKDKVFFLNSWYKNQKKVKNFMLIKYEDLKNNPQKELARILSFLGMNNLSEDFLNMVIDFSSLENMKKINLSSLENKNHPAFGKPPTKQTIRKGQVGGYKDYFTKDDIEYFQNYLKNNLLYDFGYNYFKKNQ